MTSFPGGPCCWGWNEFLEAEPHHHLCDCSTPNLQRISGKIMMEWFTQSVKGKAVSRETPSLLFCVGQHSALEAIQRRLRQSERLLAYLDDVFLVSQPDRARDAYNVAEKESWTHVKIHIHAGRTHMWNRSGRMTEGCDELQRRAVLHDPTAQVFGGGLLSPRGSRGSKCWSVFCVMQIS